ncbi:MAG: heavy-metal-associated domain-containing protein [Kiritimatiellia bacterium]
MGRFVILVLILLSAAGCSSLNNSSGPAADDERLTSYRTVILVVHGLSCPLCASNIENGLRKVDEIESSSIDLKTGEVTVKLKEEHSVTRARLAKAVADSGFTLKEIRTAGVAE